MLNERRAYILDLVTETYIQSAYPVPSSLIAEQLQVSSATVRNEFSALEFEGYLQQPHTSAGRIPTARGYEYYVRKFIPPKHLPDAQLRLLSGRFKGTHGESLLAQVAAVTAELSGYAVIVSLPVDASLQALEIHLSPLSSTKLLAVVVLENGLIRQLVVDLDPAPDSDTLREAESSLRQLTVPISEVPTALRSLSQHANDDMSRTLEALAQAWPAVIPPRLFTQGLNNLLSEPESSDPSFVRTLIEHIENPDLSAEKISDTLMIFVDEHLSHVNARLPFGNSAGALALIGPTRMRYKDALMIAYSVSQTIGAYTDSPKLN